MSDKRRSLLSFVLGIVVGAVLGAAAFHFYSTRCEKGPMRPNWAEKRKEFLSELQTKLKLDSEQDKRISAILEAKGKQLGEIRSSIHPQFAKIREESRKQIREVLRPDQLPIFDQIVAERKKRWEEREKLERR
jgi:hypothetical protein